jgi:succinate-acetate transporter protein
LSTTDDVPATATTPAAPALAVADPAPLGLAGFALTTFLLSVANAGWMKNGSGVAFLGYAIAFGGLAQLLAGMWEFRNKNVFGATAFSSYGGFWIGLGLWAILVHPAQPEFGKDVAWILLSFAIFNTYMLLWSTLVSPAVFMVFLTLELTEVVGFVGGFAGNSTVIKIGGVIGVITALVAWYTSAGLVGRNMLGRDLLPLGKPFGALAARL